MTTFRTFIFGLFAMFLSSVALGQTGSIGDAHKKLTEDYNALKKKNTELNAGKVHDVKKHVEEVGTLLAAAKKQENEVERKLNAKDKEGVKQELEAIKKHQASAETQYQRMKEEAARPTPNVTKIKEYSKLMNSQIVEAEKQHAAMKSKTGQK